MPSSFLLQSKNEIEATRSNKKSNKKTLQRSLLTRRRMAIMENASSNIAQGGPNTPGAPPTPQEQTSYVEE